MALKPQLFGFDGAVDATRASFVTVAVWWALFSVPLFRNVPEAPRAIGEPAQGWRELWQTLQQVRRMRQLWMFLFAYWLYIDGVNTIIDLAVDFGLKLGLKSQSLIAALLIVQFIGFPAAVAYGRLAERIGTRPAIFSALVVYGAVTCWGYVLSTELQFFVMACVIGCVQGGIQALSRSYYSRLVPRDKAGEFFGFYNMLGKFAAVLGPLMVGATAALTGNPRAAILTLLVLFIAGGILLARVREPAIPAGQAM
jgi:UMF1 family MFS transporter